MRSCLPRSWPLWVPALHSGSGSSDRELDARAAACLGSSPLSHQIGTLPASGVSFTRQISRLRRLHLFRFEALKRREETLCGVHSRTFFHSRRATQKRALRARTSVTHWHNTMPREPAADSIQGRLPSCNDASGTSGAQKAEELAAALERERALRQQHEQALEAALDEVMERSRLLQRRMDRGSIRHTLDGELGSPRRLQSLARRGGTEDPFEEKEVLNRLGHEEMDDEVREREPSTSSQHRVRFASTAFTIAHEVPNRHHRQHLPPPRQQPSPQEDMGEVVHALRSELAHQTAEINAMRASGKQLEAELAATRQALDGARGVASARGEVLRRLLRLTGGHEAGGLLEEVGDQQRTEAEQEAWAERAGPAGRLDRGAPPAACECLPLRGAAPSRGARSEARGRGIGDGRAQAGGAGRGAVQAFGRGSSRDAARHCGRGAGRHADGGGRHGGGAGSRGILRRGRPAASRGVRAGGAATASSYGGVGAAAGVGARGGGPAGGGARVRGSQSARSPPRAGHARGGGGRQHEHVVEQVKYLYRSRRGATAPLGLCTPHRDSNPSFDPCKNRRDIFSLLSDAAWLMQS